MKRNNFLKSLIALPITPFVAIEPEQPFKVKDIPHTGNNQHMITEEVLRQWVEDSIKDAFDKHTKIKISHGDLMSIINR